ncbi:major facilitator superfamily domain-containing protein [Ilyonectria robusta]|uniref:major facilitator superfamily domain-containing protein n=1 Tax=Ilyonectria robusta TaxID=1079257 RepID=UPI001E8E000D|nr:major facilitator superfamily domain-containing protein [Ilyonectria robusta]KAH8688315.1 major facilitator superfamily domain-containing protein [Ilyonectria robusta]
MDENLDENAIREIEDELNTKIYPGTEIMRDVGNHHFVKAGDRVGEAQVLVPQPSNDPHDPLNWNKKWKTITIICGSLLSFSLNLGPLANAPLFEAYIHEWGCSLAEAIQFTGIAILVLGFSNFIWVPMSTCFGRRPVMILSSLICAISSIWRARATSYGSFMGASVLNGIGAGPCETVMPQIIADMIFLHDRGKYQTLYFTTYFSSLMIGPIIAGAMADHHGWRSFWWWNTALLFFTCAVNAFFFPETRYHREMPAALPNQTAGTEIEKQKSNEGTASIKEEGEAERAAPATINPTGEHTWLSRGKPSKKQFVPWGKYQGNLIRELWLPWYLHFYPIVEFASFAVSFTACGFLLANLTQQQALSPPPYNFSPQSVGFTNFAILAGGLIGLFTSGPLSDWVSDYLTKRNNGVREPEMRLVTMIPYVFIMILGSVVVAVGYDYHWPWEAIVVIGYTCLGIQVTSLPSIASTYAIDSYKPITGSMFVTITINKNVWGYGFSKYITPWAEKDGFIPPMLTTMALIVFFCSFGILFWYFGKYFRGLTKDSFVHRL